MEQKKELGKPHNFTTWGRPVPERLPDGVRVTEEKHPQKGGKKRNDADSLYRLSGVTHMQRGGRPFVRSEPADANEGRKGEELGGPVEC